MGKFSDLIRLPEFDRESVQRSRRRRQQLEKQPLGSIPITLSL